MSADGTMFAPPPAAKRKKKVADLFCGSGGLTTGAMRAAKALGFELEVVAVNHWAIAIQTHARNHPDAIHHCADLEHTRPLDAVPGGYLDLLMAAPSCTFHSRARGGKPVNDQQRMDPWHVVRWCTELRVKRLLVENVPEFMKWGPCDTRTGKPIKSRQGEYFRAWLAALQSIGFKLDWKVVNCADYGDATTRERFLLMGRSDGKALRRPQQTHSQLGGEHLFGSHKPWQPIGHCIDWADLGTSLFDRPKPLVPKTIARLLAGARRERWPRQYIEALQALLDGKVPRLKVTETEAIEISRQLGAGLVMASPSGAAARSTNEPTGTLTTAASQHFITPIIAPYYGGGSGLTAQSSSHPAPTITTKARFGLASPFIIPITHTGDRAHLPITEPIKTITGANRGEFALGRPVITGYKIDILYRMLRWIELSRATSFELPGEPYVFTGNVTQIIKQIGNAVPCKTAAAHVYELLAAA